MTGYDDGNFYPNETMTRGMAATVLYRLSGDSVSYQKIFSDVKAGAYYSEAITWTYTNNIMTGYSGYGGLFGVDDCVTREQLAKILYQYGLYLGLDLNTNQSLSKFKDADQVSSFAQKGMKWLVHENIMTGSNNGTTLEPARNATRAECAKLFLYAKDVYDSLSSSVTHAAGIKNLANGKTVCYDENGNYLTGVQKVNGSMYFFSTDTGYMVKNTTVNIDNVLYFADANTGELSATNRKIDTSMMNIHNTYSPYPEDANDYDCDYSDAIGDIEYIVIHYTAGSTSVSGSAANTLDWFNSINTASATFCIDDANIMQYTDYEAGYRDWHCGGTPTNNGYGGAYLGIATNRNSIGIEVCSTNSTGDLSTANTTAWSFTEAVIDNTVALVQSLLNRFPNAQVIRHYDVTGKLCPGIIGWNDYKDADDSAWQAFLQRVYSAN
jgi:N-acetyl-anhydromuramyl-L-alanine amidase AmpD